MAKIDRPARRELHSRAWPGAPGAARPKFAPRRRPRSAYVSARGARVILELLRRRGGRKQSFFTARASLPAFACVVSGQSSAPRRSGGGQCACGGFWTVRPRPRPARAIFFAVASKLLTRTRSDRVAITSLAPTGFILDRLQLQADLLSGAKQRVGRLPGHVRAPDFVRRWPVTRPRNAESCARAIALDDCALDPRRLQFEHDCCVRARTNIEM